MIYFLNFNVMSYKLTYAAVSVVKNKARPLHRNLDSHIARNPAVSKNTFDPADMLSVHALFTLGSNSVIQPQHVEDITRNWDKGFLPYLVYHLIFTL